MSHFEGHFEGASTFLTPIIYCPANWFEFQNNTLLYVLTINVPLFKKLRDIIFFLWDNNFMSHFEGHFEGAKTFLTP